MLKNKKKSEFRMEHHPQKNTPAALCGKDAFIHFMPRHTKAAVIPFLQKYPLQKRPLL